MPARAGLAQQRVALAGRRRRVRRGAVGRAVDLQQEQRVVAVGGEVAVGRQPDRAEALGRRGCPASSRAVAAAASSALVSR